MNQPMQPHQERVVVEKRELDEKLVKLRTFRFSPVFRTLEPEDRALLEDQYTVMARYSDILTERINRFSKGAH